MVELLLFLVIIAPAAGVLLIAFATHRNGHLSSLISCSSVGVSFLFSLYCVYSLMQMSPEHRVIDVDYFPWIQAGSFFAPFGLHLDPLSAVMILVVTGVGLLIHIYSIGYMHGDPYYSRYFAYLNLFIFSMLILVLANNYVLLFVGWELVGLCSYLLIGFWFEKKSAADAGKKAFIVNRIGDFGFLIGVFTVFVAFGSVTFREVFARSSTVAPAVITAASLWLFCGAIGKSAQFPLHVWLPDAMEGPTPVSALIHAATMVTAGVYMVARSFPLFSQSDVALVVVLTTGTFTAIFAASMALAQYDIKRVMAYSTVSQLGYMFMALGAGAFSAAIFHLMTHAFFKALLFLACGSVMHAMANETDFRKMGGLWGPLRKTGQRFWIGGLALAGILPFAGFWSKDTILLGAFSMEHGKWIVWSIGLITAFLTAYYTFRVIFRIFHAEPEDAHVVKHAHESRQVMLFPLTLLALLSIIGGWVGTPWMNAFGHFLEPVFDTPHHKINMGTEVSLMLAALIVAAGGIYLAYQIHYKKPEVPAQLLASKPYLARIHQILYRKYYVDEIYHAIFVRPILFLSEKLFFRVIDVNMIDAFVNDIGAILRSTGGAFRRLQTGDARAYAAAILIGTLGLLAYFAWMVR
ncbi:NADH-quinone oxidoreductase subunit L [bacterium]|nr:NADH-quinone oxidoreductase subunit L [bacterium]MCI0604822.1 NADH-quinone oxidoreductase subunit L [bacterium]